MEFGPDVQVVIHPTLSDEDVVVVLGARLNFAF